MTGSPRHTSIVYEILYLRKFDSTRELKTKEGVCDLNVISSRMYGTLH